MLKRIILLSATCMMAVGLFFACNDKQAEVVKPTNTNLSSARTSAELATDPEFGKFYSATPILCKSLNAKLNTMTLAQQKAYVEALPGKINAADVTIDQQAALLGVTKQTFLTYASTKYTLGKSLVTKYPQIKNKEYLAAANKQYIENKYTQWRHPSQTDCSAWKECWTDANFEYAIANVGCVVASETFPSYVICEMGIYAGWVYKSYNRTQRNDSHKICFDLYNSF